MQKFPLIRYYAHFCRSCRYYGNSKPCRFDATRFDTTGIDTMRVDTMGFDTMHNHPQIIGGSPQKCRNCGLPTVKIDFYVIFTLFFFDFPLFPDLHVFLAPFFKFVGPIPYFFQLKVCIWAKFQLYYTRSRLTYTNKKSRTYRKHQSRSHWSKHWLTILPKV